jgi:hypothetical protein
MKNFLHTIIFPASTLGIGLFVSIAGDDGNAGTSSVSPGKHLKK